MTFASFSWKGLQLDWSHVAPFSIIDVYPQYYLVSFSISIYVKIS